jgi:hypothetical protein
MSQTAILLSHTKLVNKSNTTGVSGETETVWPTWVHPWGLVDILIRNNFPCCLFCLPACYLSIYFLFCFLFVLCVFACFVLFLFFVYLLVLSCFCSLCICLFSLVFVLCVFACFLLFLLFVYLPVFSCFCCVFLVCLCCCPFCVGYCDICSSLIDQFWLPIWYLQKFLTITMEYSIFNKRHYTLYFYFKNSIIIIDIWLTNLLMLVVPGENISGTCRVH